MIISHRLKLIFVKPKKVAGTSFEIALSEYCGDDDVITPVSAGDEQLRADLGYPGAQNFERMGNRNYVDTAPPNLVFRNHLPAAKIRACIAPEVWDEYLKVSIVRNPFDAMVSRYFWKKTFNDFAGFIDENPRALGENFRIAPPELIDYFIQYKTLSESLKQLESLAGISGLERTFSAIQSKGGIRPRNTRSVEEFYRDKPDVVARMCAACADEISHFGYAVPSITAGN